MRTIDPRTTYIKLDPWVALINIINDKYRLDLQKETTKLVEFTPMEGTRTAVRVSSNRSTRPENALPPFTERTFHYDRIELSEFFNSGIVSIGNLRAPTTTHQLVKWLSKQYNFAFASDDFINDIIETDQELNSYVLEANPRSLRWVGSVVLSNGNNKIDLAGLTNVSLTNTLNYGTGVVGKADGGIILMDLDFTQYRSELGTLKVGTNTISHKRLSMIINRMTGFKQTWRCAGEPTTWNIGVSLENDIPRYNVLYNGPVANNRWSPRLDIRNVIVLELSDTLCTNLSGYILLHYN